VELCIEIKDFIALKELVPKFKLMDLDVLVKAMIQFEFGDIKMLEDWIDVQR
jgi:hypothetical protein